jgi:hypothetical protein
MRILPKRRIAGFEEKRRADCVVEKPPIISFWIERDIEMLKEGKHPFPVKKSRHKDQRSIVFFGFWM